MEFSKNNSLSDKAQAGLGSGIPLPPRSPPSESVLDLTFLA
jgi:hypothetical protein